jgi:hypothetical protein
MLTIYTYFNRTNIIFLFLSIYLRTFSDYMTDLVDNRIY